MTAPRAPNASRSPVETVDQVSSLALLLLAIVGSGLAVGACLFLI